MSDRADRLHRLVEGVIASYNARGNINHLDEQNLPARDEVERVLDDLVSLVFPGFFGADSFDHLNARYAVGERCTRTLRALESLITRVLRMAPSLCQPAVSGCAEGLAFQLLETIPAIREIVDVDVQAALAGDPAASSTQEVISSYPGVRAVTVYRLAHAMYRAGVPLLPRMMSEIVHGRTGIDIHPGAQIQPGFFIDHGTGVVVGETSVIGRHVTLYQGVTLGALSVNVAPQLAGNEDKRHPTLEDHVTVYAGATILGGCTVIGEASVIGGNVWLTHSVPPRTTVMIDKPALRMMPRSQSPQATGT